MRILVLGGTVFLSGRLRSGRAAGLGPAAERRLPSEFQADFPSG